MRAAKTRSYIPLCFLTYTWERTHTRVQAAEGAAVTIPVRRAGGRRWRQIVGQSFVDGLDRKGAGITRRAKRWPRQRARV